MEYFSSVDRKRLPLMWPALCLMLGGILLFQNSESLARERSTPREISERGPLNSRELTTIDIFQKSSPSVVFITTKALRRDFFRLNVMEIPRGTGSGFIWDNQGHIVTNFHVIQNADRIEVTLTNHKTYEAELVGVAVDKDIAVLRIKGSQAELIPIPVGTSSDLLVGQMVYAIGNPFGLDQTLTTGIVSALGRTIQSVSQQDIEGVIQTDAAINPGNSGGPLLDSAGRLIGVNTAIYSPSGSSAGIGFAVPVDTVNEVVPQLIQYGKPLRAGLGIQTHENNDLIMRRMGQKGVLVYRVTPDSPAAEAGFQGVSRNRYGDYELGDIIIAIDDNPIELYKDLRKVLGKYKVNETAEVTLLRDGKEIKVDVLLKAL